MNSPPILTDVSLAINLANSTRDQGATAAQALVAELQRLELPAIWILDPTAPKTAPGVCQLAPADFELALAVTARTPQRLRSELANLQTEVRATCGKEISTVVGDAQALRSRAAVLADFGIGAVISAARDAAVGKPPRSLPCGLWQFEVALSVPQSRGLWSWLPTRRPNVKSLLAAAVAGNPQVIAIDLAQLRRRELQGCVSLLDEIATARRQGQLQVTNVSDLAAELTSRNVVKPQRSILRRAA